MGLSYAIAELTHDVEYTVRVIATNGVGDGAAVEATATPSDTTPPQLSTATVNGRFLELGYDDPVDGDSVPRASDFSVAVAGAAREVERVSVARREVTLILASAVTRSDAVTVSYIAPPEVSEPRILGRDWQCRGVLQRSDGEEQHTPGRAKDIHDQRAGCPSWQHARHRHGPDAGRRCKREDRPGRRRRLLQDRAGQSSGAVGAHDRRPRHHGETAGQLRHTDCPQ